MIKLNEYQTMELFCDIMSVHEITFRQFATHFFQSRAKNKESFLKTLDLTKEDIKKLKVIDSKNLHTDMIEEFCNE